MTDKSASGLHAFVVVNPAQDYRQETQMWGIYGSLDEAKSVTPQLRYRWCTDDEDEGVGDRYTLVEEWCGDALIAAWKFHPRNAPQWEPVAFAPRDPRYHRRNFVQPWDPDFGDDSPR